VALAMFFAEDGLVKIKSSRLRRSDLGTQGQNAQSRTQNKERRSQARSYTVHNQTGGDRPLLEPRAQQTTLNAVTVM